MDAKERVKRAIAHEETDVVPYHFSFTIPAARKLAGYYGTDDFESLLGNHLAIVEPVPADAWCEISPDIWRDEWGVLWDRHIDKDIGTPSNLVLPERDLSTLKVPDPDKPGRFDSLEETLERYPDRFVMGGIGFSLFERAWTLRGMENLLVDMVEAPGFVDELLDAIVEFNLAVIDHILSYPVDAVRFGDDWGQQRGLIMGPKLWRRFIKPRLARMYGRVKEGGRLVCIHSCGDVKEIFPDLIELGVDIFNPFQPEVMDIVEMKLTYGDRISFYGGLSIQRVLPYSTPDGVRAEVKRLIDVLGRDGGYILSPSHDVPGDVPVENLLAAIEAAQEQ